MKYKLISGIFFICLLSTISFVYGQEACAFAYQEECYDTFDDFFTNDPISAATTYPAAYMTHLSANPNLITQNPAAYEAVIIQDVAYINQDINAFSSYLETKEVHLTIKGQISTYDAASGTIMTEGTLGFSQKYYLSTTLDTIKELEAMGNSDFELSYGLLSYTSPNKPEMRTVLSGTILTQKGAYDNQEVVITNGKVAVQTKGNLYAVQPIEIRNDNKAIVSGDFVTLEVGSDTPISLPTGLLMKGTVSGILEDSFALHENSVYTSKKGTEFSTGKGARIYFTQDTSDCGNFYCVTENDESLIIEPSHAHSDITITTIDGTYQNVVVREFQQEEAALTLLIQNKENKEKTALFLFSQHPPKTKGNINGLESNIGHIYTLQDKKYPWMLYNGKPKEYQDGTNQEILTTLIEQKDMTPEEIQLLVSAVDLSAYDLNELLLLTDDVDRQYAIFEAYRTTYDQEGQLSEETTISLTDLSPELLHRIIENTETYHDVTQTLRLLNEFPQLQAEIIEGIDTFEDFQVLTSVSDPALKKQILDKIDFSSDSFRKESTKGVSFRMVLSALSDDPEALRYALEQMPDRADMDFYPRSLSTIYFDESFQTQTVGLDFANRYSVATTAERYLRQSNQDITTENLASVTEKIIQEREQFADYSILDEDTYYIPITHEESYFENDEMVQLAREAGVQDIADPSLKGSADKEETKRVKEQFLSYVAESQEKGKTTIHFSNHGGSEHQWLMSGTPGSQESDNLHIPEAISYVELGDTLLERGDLSAVTIMIDSCYSYDFKNNLYTYLSRKGSEEYPIVITETNRGQVGKMRDTIGENPVPGEYKTVFQTALGEAHEAGKPLTGRDIYEAEAKTFVTQDLSISIPYQHEDKDAITTTNTIFEMGSTYDDGALEKPIRDAGDKSTIKPATLPTSIIEIAANEQEMLETIGLA